MLEQLTFHKKYSIKFLKSECSEISIPNFKMSCKLRWRCEMKMRGHKFLKSDMMIYTHINRLFNSRFWLCHFTLVTALNNFCQLSLNYRGRNVQLSSDFNTESDMFYTPQGILYWRHICVFWLWTLIFMLYE